MPLTEANTVKGLLLGIDRRKVKEAQIVEGRNFFVDIDGPRSGFARTEIAHNAFSDPLFVQTFNTDADTASWIFLRDSILRPDVLNGRFLPVLTYTPSSVDYPWTHALVGGKHYFAKRGIGLLEYNPTTGAWMTVDGVSYGVDVPANIVSCCEAGGRLVVAAQGLVAWSVIDDGTIFTTSTATGAGFQALSKIGSYSLDSVQGVYRTANGFMTFTKNGIMKSELITSITVFRHTPLNFKHVALNAFCIQQINDETVVFLTLQGFYSSSGQVPQSWEPLMSEYFRLYIFPGMADTSEGVIKLQYTDYREWMFVSISDTLQKSLYNRAYIWSAKSGQWGSFNKIHTGIAEILLDDGPNKGINLGYVDAYGNGYLFDFDTTDILFPDLTTFDYWYLGKVQYSARTEDGVAKMPSVWYLLSIDETPLLASATGVYNFLTVEQDSDDPELADLIAATVVNASTYVAGGTSQMRADWYLGTGIQKIIIGKTPVKQEGLDSYIAVGAFRTITGNVVAEYSLITNVLIGMLDSATIGITYEDYIADYSSDVFEDWLTYTPDLYEDWGIAPSAVSQYKARLQSSIDAFTPLEGMDNYLNEVTYSGRSKLFESYGNGVFHILRIEASDIGESFHLKALELSGVPSGVLA